MMLAASGPPIGETATANALFTQTSVLQTTHGVLRYLRQIITERRIFAAILT